jgi:nucleotide-binding universal stress UspA family protein
MKRSNDAGMPLVCGTDFSEMASHAATVAAALAAATGAPLHLVHAIDLWPEEVREQPGHPLVLWGESRLAREAARLRLLGADVLVRLEPGAAEDILRSTAHEVGASLIVVGALGHRGDTPRKLGSRADRTAQHSHVPVLAVRDSAPFLSWMKEQRPLRVLIGVDASASAEHAARWLDGLCRLGACEVVLAHLYWPPETFHRLGLGGLRSFVEPDTEIVKTLERQLSQRFDGLLHGRSHSYRIEPHLGRVGDGLALLAAEAHADLLVVGCHDQSALARLWEGSVSRQALRASSVAVACVPAPARALAKLDTPRFRHVLAATDFSELGNDAIPLAYAAVAPGGTVHLVHVLKAHHGRLDPYDLFTPLPDPTLSEAANAAGTRLRELVPGDASAKSASTQVHVVEAADAAVAICQAAERLDADLLCLGTHGRGGVAKAFLGSVAMGVVDGTRRPLLLARAKKA